MESKSSQEVLQVEPQLQTFKIHIASDPDQTFFIQADATVTGSAGLGVGVVNAPYIVGTGSHKTGQSAYVLDASGHYTGNKSFESY